MSSWQKTLLVIASMALVVICNISTNCGGHNESVSHLAYVVVGAVFGLTMPKADRDKQE